MFIFPQKFINNKIVAINKNKIILLSNTMEWLGARFPTTCVVQGHLIVNLYCCGFVTLRINEKRADEQHNFYFFCERTK